MEHIRIDYTDIILQELGDGKGKIIISNDDYGYNFSYYWGAMGKDTTIKQFIQQINSDYFVGKLSSGKKGPMDVRKTFVNLRASIKEDFQYELKWYEHMEFQKDFREKLREFQQEVSCDHEFMQRINCFTDELDFYLIDDRGERERIEKLFKDIFSQSEPWNFIEYETPREEIFLKKLHAKLKKVLLKPVQLCLF